MKINATLLGLFLLDQNAWLAQAFNLKTTSFLQINDQTKSVQSTGPLWAGTTNGGFFDPSNGDMNGGDMNGGGMNGGGMNGGDMNGRGMNGGGMNGGGMNGGGMNGGGTNGMNDGGMNGGSMNGMNGMNGMNDGGINRIMNGDMNGGMDRGMGGQNPNRRKKKINFLDPGLLAPATPVMHERQMADRNSANLKSKHQVWQESSTVVIQGGSLRTCAFEQSVDRVQILLRTEGRPLNSNVELWQGPDNTPQKVNVYLENGSERQFRCVIETPRGSNAVSIYNTGKMELPFQACVDPEVENINGNPSDSPAKILSSKSKSKIVQGGAVYTIPFSPSIQSVQVMLSTDGRPMNAKIELLQGPSNVKQIMEIYNEDGTERPFWTVIDTPGSGNVVRIVNTSTVEYPLHVTMEPYEITKVEEPEQNRSTGNGNGNFRWSD